MNPYRFFRHSVAIILAVHLLTGCVHLDKPYPDIQFHRLQFQNPIPSKGMNGNILSITRFTEADNYGDRFFVYRTEESTFESDFYQQFNSNPKEIIQEQVSAWLRTSPCFGLVIDQGTAENPNFSLSGKLLEIYGDYQDSKQPKAILKFGFILTQLDGTNHQPSILMQKIYPSSITINQISPNALVQGWNQGLQQIMMEFEKDLKAKIPCKANPPNQIK